MLNYIPTESLIQHEWSTHGTCSGLTAGEYFSAVRKAREAVIIPAEFKAPSREMHLSPGQIASKFAAANPSFPPGAFRVSCQNNALQEVRVCLTKDLRPRNCGSSAGMCRLDEMLVRPVQ
jgi:ribonuclease T2